MYDTLTRSILPNGTSAARVSSFMNPVANPDDSYDLYSGPTPVAGHGQNFVKTVPGNRHGIRSSRLPSMAERG